MTSPTAKTGSQEVSQPLIATNATSYGTEQEDSSIPKVDPTVLARKIIAEQNPAPPPIVYATFQQILSLPNGQYEGDVKNGLPHGMGTLTYHPGLIYKKYEGQWQNGQMHGRGTMYYANGAKYVGNMQNSQKHGRGRYTYPREGHFEGVYKNNTKWTGKSYDGRGNSWTYKNGKGELNTTCCSLL